MSSPQFSRRSFVQRCAVGATAVGLGGQRVGRSPLVTGVVSDDPARRVDPSRVKQLALQAVDDATAAGAQYADVRLTHTIEKDPNRNGDTDVSAVGVRCFINGYWGFAAGSVWTSEEMSRLARRAASIAAANAKGPPRSAQLAPTPVVTGDWTMPGVIDPVTVPLEEQRDFLESLPHLYDVSAYGLNGTLTESVGAFCYTRQERALATSAGTYVTQTVWDSYYTETFYADLSWFTPTPGASWGPSVNQTFRGMSYVGRGWENFLEAKFEEQIPKFMAEKAERMRAIMKPVQIGYYDVVVDAEVMALLVNATLGPATELDRALGYEANAGGTSYLGPDPLALLGQYQVGAPLLTLTANRSTPGAGATVKWDDEGVEPEETVLVRQGVLTDYQTTREQAGWLAPYYQKIGKPVRSHGYAASESAIHPTLQHRPNLAIAPGPEQLTLADLIKGVKRGVAVCGGGQGSVSVTSDWQAKTGQVTSVRLTEPVMREIVNGKLGAFLLPSTTVSFSAPSLWANLRALGGAGSVEAIGGLAAKGQPAQQICCGTSAVPGLFARMAVLDSARGQ